MENLIHGFYTKTSKQQNRFVWKIGLSLFFLIVILLALALLLKWYFLIIFIPFLIITVASFVDVPGGVKSGQLKHFSPLFLASKERKNVVVIHGGTLFDYYFTLHTISSGAERRKVIMVSQLSGLLQLINQYEAEGRSEVIIKGTSYIINRRTADKIGFTTTGPDAVQMIIMMLNYLPIMLCYSYAKGKISFPNLLNASTFYAPVKNLSANKEMLIHLIRRLSRTSAH